jgi:hypothetical protein
MESAMERADKARAQQNAIRRHCYRNDIYDTGPYSFSKARKILEREKSQWKQARVHGTAR